MKNWWLGLNSREQLLVGGMSILLVVFLFIMLIWQPLNENTAKAEKKLKRQQALLQYVVENTAIAKASGGQRRASSSGSLSSVINRTANQQRIAIARMQPQGDQIQVWIDEVPFNQLMTWLSSLAQNESIKVNAIDISNGDKAGQVVIRRLQLGRI